MQWFIGEGKDKQQRKGKGESWAPGSRYRGQYRQGLRHGHSVYRFFRGDCYAGGPAARATASELLHVGYLWPSSPDFVDVARSYPSVLASRCFTCCPTDAQVIKAKKRRLGRAEKIIGDYCLLAGSPADANAHYTRAI